ncbi:hypothetical protein [Actinoallomurus iriomotensis]|uniref:Uncharacterized protein n=1 Tax=Actinoallomurus iriomotensis TaxID=478107 RepID=A0A9W6S8Y0_9ACTN|nr:hypothetical protein [Actinoallomurus iriomotensis]GLY87867.1 hypothetical protein Airi02_057960 [Actinoallomurus iriomotensis]
MRNVLSRRRPRRPHTTEDQAADAHHAADVQTPHQRPVRHRAYMREHPHEHQREASLAFITIVGGVIAFVCGAVHPTHFIAVCVGIVTVVFGFYSQLVSATTAERWVNVIGLGLAFLGLGLGLRHGGFRI